MINETHPDDEQDSTDWHEPLLPHYFPELDADGNLIINPNVEISMFDDGTGKVYPPRPFLKLARNWLDLLPGDTRNNISRDVTEPPMVVNALGWDLTIEQLDELIAYLEAVRRAKAEGE